MILLLNCEPKNDFICNLLIIWCKLSRTTEAIDSSTETYNKEKVQAIAYVCTISVNLSTRSCKDLALAYVSDKAEGLNVSK